MLDSMRSLSKSIVSKLLMVFLVISFAVWGIGDIVRDSGPSYAAKVGNETISIGEFQQQRELVKRQLETLGMKEIPQDRLAVSVIRQLIQQKLTLMEMREMGLVVNENLVGRAVAQMPEFRNKDGKFDGKLFTTLLARQNLSEKTFVGQLKQEISGRFLADSLSMHDAPAPTSVLALDATIAGETRDAVLLTVPAKAVAEEADEPKLKEYYEANKELSYMRPETRTLEYVVLSDAELDKYVGASVSKESIESLMKAQPEMNEGLARMKLTREQRDEALHTLGNAIEDELAGGKTMGEAFAKAGISVEPRTLQNVTAELAKTSTNDVTRTVAEQGFGLSEGEISRLITSKKGALLMVSAKKITPISPKPYEEVKADVATQLRKQYSREAARTKAATVKEKLAKAENWQAVAQEYGLSARAVSRVARPAEGKPAASGIPQALQMALFERPVGEVAGPLSQENGDQLLALITESHSPKVDAAAIAPTKENQQLGDKLGQAIESRAFESFIDGHKITINPQLMAPASGGGE